MSRCKPKGVFDEEINPPKRIYGIPQVPHRWDEKRGCYVEAPYTVYQEFPKAVNGKLYNSAAELMLDDPSS